MPAIKTPCVVTVYYRTFDGFSQSRQFKTLEGAQKYAQAKIGVAPELGGGYAVSPWGDAKITCNGWFTAPQSGAVTVADLFPAARGE
jgi:hypothetical protein